jgi:hypothetical protein
LCRPLVLFNDWTKLELDEATVAQVALGGKLSIDTGPSTAREIVAVDRHNQLVAILRPASDGRWRPALNFARQCAESS